MINQEQVKEQVIDNANTSSETIKNHYVISDVKKDDEVIFDFYPTSLNKKIGFTIDYDDGYFEKSENKLFLTEKDAKNGVDEFKKEPVPYEDVNDYIEDRFHSLYSVTADEDDDYNYIVPKELENDNIKTSFQKMSVSDYINKEIEDHERDDYFSFKEKTRTEKENQVISWLNNQLKRQGVDYECVRLFSDNKQTFGLIKKEKIDETKKI
jgi:hypothetical protein